MPLEKTIPTPDLNHVLQQARETKEFRPCVVAIIEDSEGRFLFVRSVKSVNSWGFPQGGVDDEETLSQALFREIAEETGIDPSNLTLNKFIGCNDLDIPHEPGRDHRGYSRGKRYFAFHIKYNGPDEIRLPPEELDQYEWVKPDEVGRTIASIREEKRTLILKQLKSL